MAISCEESKMRSVYCKANSCIQHLHIYAISTFKAGRPKVSNDKQWSDKLKLQSNTFNKVKSQSSFSTKSKLLFSIYESCWGPQNEFLGKLSCIGICSVNSQCQPSYLNQ